MQLRPPMRTASFVHCMRRPGTGRLGPTRGAADQSRGAPSRAWNRQRIGGGRAGARDGMTGGDHTGRGLGRVRHADADFPGWGVCGCRGRIVCTPNSPVLDTPASEATQQLMIPYPPLALWQLAITPLLRRAAFWSTVGCFF